MKKAIALTLALTMASAMSAPAFAGSDPIAPNTYAPGSEISILSENFKNSDGVSPEAALERGSFTLSAKWDRGGAMVGTVKIDDKDGEVVILLKENYTIDEAKDLKGTITLKAKDSARTEYTYALAEDTTIKVTNRVEEVEGTKDPEDAFEYDAEINDTIYQNGEDTPGYVVFKSGSDMLTAALKMDRNEKVFMHISEKEIEEVSEKYNPDNKASLYFFDFESAPSLRNEATLSVEADYFSDAYVYEYVNGKLMIVNAKLNKDGDAYQWQTRRPTTYVVSDTKLRADGYAGADKNESNKGEEANPDTGANDVVGAAAALAVVSLTAAGAAALKKKH